MKNNEKGSKTKGGVGLIGMNRNTGIIRSQMPEHAIRASVKRAVKKSFNSDRAAANFKKRVAEYGKNEASPEKEQDFIEESVEISAEQKSMNIKKQQAAKKLNISLAELDRRLELIKKAIFLENIKNV